MNGIVKGKVNGMEGPLQYATVSIGNKSILTDDQGKFYLSVEPGNYILIVTHSGFNKFNQYLTIKAGSIKIFEVGMTVNEQMGLVVVLGSRSAAHQSNLNTPVPVVIVNTGELFKISQSEITQMIAANVPSYNSTTQTAGFTGITLAALRGLNPDQTLVLMNERRYHSTALLKNENTISRGTVGTDLNSIPASAVEKVEILCDGASAQYGSDAIAGVIDVQLKKSTGKTSINLHLGQYYEGDGGATDIGINRGISLNKKGFLNLSFDLRYRAATNRAGEYKGTVYYQIPPNSLPTVRDSILALDNRMIRERGFSRSNYWPDGITEQVNTGVLVNGAYSLAKNKELFWTGLLNNRINYGVGAYRYPYDTLNVITELFPDGFLAGTKASSMDFAGIIGIDGKTQSGWHWDLSTTYGGNSFRSILRNTNNATQIALGKYAQTEFYCGTQKFAQNTNNINFTRDFAKGTGRIKSLNLATGAEFRVDNYQIAAGEEASWFNYDTASLRLGGSQVLQGFQPRNAVNENRYVTSAYTEVQTELNEKLLLQIAGRYEYYSDFGGNLAGKLALRYKLSSHLTLRGSLSNGFRAPTMQQRYYSLSSQVVRPEFGFIPKVQGIFPNNSELARAFGIPSLQAEKSLNLSGGIVSTISPNISLTIDVYWIQIKNYIVLSGNFPRWNNPIVDSILSKYHSDADFVAFFTNAINTHTQGVDLVLNGNWQIRKARLGIMLAANYNRTNLFGNIQTTDKLQNASVLFNRQEIGRIEKGQPTDKIILLINYTIGKVGFTLRNIHFGEVASINTDKSKNLDEFFSPKVVTNLEVHYTPKTWVTITAGARNIFNVYPDPLQHVENTNGGHLIYGNNVTQFGYNGGYYFLTMSFNF